MALETSLGDLFKEETIDANKILDKLLDPKNIDMKTHIISPITFAYLEGVVNNIEILLGDIKGGKIKLPLTTKLLKDIVKKIKLFMVSKDRLSRTEITETLKSIRQEGATERSFFQKLLGTSK